MKNPLVSVIIPTLNSEKLILNCLKSIKNQTYKNIEIIVVDGHSKDRTVDIAKRYAKVYIYGPDQSKERVFGGPYQRNYGVSKAKGKYIYYVDSDMELTPNVIKDCVYLINKKNADAVIVPEESFGKSFWAKCKWLERRCYWGDDLIEAPRFIKRDVWNKLGGLDVKLGGGDDWDFHRRLKLNGYKIVRTKELVMHNEGELTLRKLFKKKFIYGKTVTNYFKKHKDKSTNIKQFTIFRKAYFKNLKLFLKHPILSIGFLIMRFTEYFAALSGIIYSKFHKTTAVIK